MNYSSLFRRFLAAMLDGMILLIPCGLMNQAIPVVGPWVVWFFYSPILESSEIQATLGKRLLDIQVTDESGLRITFKTALFRNIMKAISSILLFIGFFVAIFTQKKQTVHDLLANTVVITGKNDKPVVDSWISAVKKLFNSGTF